MAARMAVNGRIGFWRGVARVSLPLWLWAAQFFGAYALVAAGAMGHLPAGVDRMMALGLVGLVALALAAIVVAAGLAWRRGERRAMESLRGGAALLALLAVAWGAVPLLALPR